MAGIAVAQPVKLLASDRANTIAQPAVQRPDIDYHPNQEQYNARTARRLADNPALPTSALPDGFPREVKSPLVWEGKDFRDEKEWVYELNLDQLEEIDNAVKHFRSLGKSFGHISPSTFPLPKLGQALRDLSNELHNGRGFFVLRTIPIDKYSREDNIIIFAGVSSYIGGLRGKMNKKNAPVLSHVKDLTGTHSKDISNAPYTADKVVFHTDRGGDIVALFALEVSEQGGASRITSTWKAYNELAATRPDLVRTLAEPWPHDRFGGDPAYMERPLLYYHDNRIIMNYSRRVFTGYLDHPRSPGIPSITEAQAEALDAIHFLGEKLNLELTLQKGDVQYINNFSIFHARDGYTDSPEHTRHLLRLWLHNEELAWKMPQELQASRQRVYYSLTPDEQYFPLEPVAGY